MAKGLTPRFAGARLFLLFFSLPASKSVVNRGHPVTPLAVTSDHPVTHQRREQERFPGTINHRLVDCQVINHMFLEIAFLGSKILSPLGGWWVTAEGED